MSYEPEPTQDEAEPSKEDEDFFRFLEDAKASADGMEALLEHRIVMQRVRLICRTVTNDPADAEDLATEVCLRIWRKLDQFKPERGRRFGNFFAWVRRIAQNLAFSDFRRKSINFGGDRPEEMPAVQSETVGVESNVEVAEALERFTKLVNALSPRDSQIMQIWVEGILNEDGYSRRQIADQLRAYGFQCSHVTVGTVIKAVTTEFTNSERPDTKEGEDTRPTPTVSRKPEQTSGRREKRDEPSKDVIPFPRKNVS